MLSAEQVLFGFLDAKRSLKLIEGKIDVIKSDLLPKSPNMTGMPSAHNHTDRYADMMVRLEELYDLEDNQRLIAINQMQVVEEIIDKVEKPILKSILYDRYIMGNKWEAIAEHMAYSEQRIYQLRRQALLEVSNILDDCK